MSFTEQKYDTLNTKWRLLNKNMNYCIEHEFTEEQYDTLNIKWRLLNKNINYWIENEFTEQQYDTLNIKWRLLNKTRNYWIQIVLCILNIATIRQSYSTPQKCAQHWGPVRGDLYVPRLNFKPFHVAISEGSHIAVGISSKATDIDIGNV